MRKKILLFFCSLFLLVAVFMAPTFTSPVQAATGGPSTMKSARALSGVTCPPTLVYGSTGYWVKKLQSYLNDGQWLGKPEQPLEVDGIYGPKTESVVSSFQRVAHLHVDGITGPQTWHALMGLC
jgi:peptidoglycan hydrolase-like protein with peptidoglycan-binding domain